MTIAETIAAVTKSFAEVASSEFRGQTRLVVRRRKPSTTCWRR